MPQGNYAGYLPLYPVRSQCWNCPNPADYLGLVCNLCLEPWSRQLEQSESLPKFWAFMDALAERNEDPSQITFIDRFPDGGEVRMKIQDVEGKPVEIAVEVTHNLEEDWHRAGESAQRRMRTMAPEKG